MLEIASRYAWSAILPNSSEERLIALCKNCTPKKYCYLTVLDTVRDFCECANVDIQYPLVPFEKRWTINSAQIVLERLGISTEINQEKGYKMSLVLAREKERV